MGENSLGKYWPCRRLEAK